MFSFDSEHCAPFAITLYCRSGIIIDLTKTVNGVKLYYKVCTNKVCLIRYFYKEFLEGIHVAPNKVCLTFRFCIDIRSLLIHNTALGRTIEANENRNKVKIPVNLNAARRSYTNFELQTSHEYDFMCRVSGKYPKILVSDVCRKNCFTLEPQQK